VSPFGAFLAQLAERVAGSAGGADEGVRLRVTSLDLDVPIESRIVGGGLLEASLPRGLMATGFDLPHGRVSARFTVEDEP
jgi:hypothetical protein